MQIKAGFCLFAASFGNARQIAVAVIIVVPRDLVYSLIAFTLQMFLRDQSLSVLQICSHWSSDKVVKQTDLYP